MEEQPAAPPAAPDQAAVANVADWLRTHAETTPDRGALVAAGPTRQVLDWAGLDARVDAVAAGLAAHGLVAGHRVGVTGVNRIEFVVAYLAALRAGYVAVPVDPHTASDDLAALCRLTGIRVLFAPTDPGLVGVHHVGLDADGLAALASAGGGRVSSPPDAEALAVLLNTAGTSAHPKPAMLTHRALLAHLEHLATVGVLDPDATVLAALPLFHVFGLNAVLGSWLRAGARLVLVDGVEGAVEAMLAERVTDLPLSPPMLERLLADEQFLAAAAHLDTVVCGAAPLAEDLRRRFTERTGLRVEQGYGLTEAAPGVSATLGGEVLGHGHVGRPLPGVEVRIGDGSEPAEPGEIWIRGDNLFSGYWPDGHGGPDRSGWFATGDIGYLSDGELFLVDRVTELIVVNGFPVYPGEVEDVIATLPGVDEVAVVAGPDGRGGRQVVAFVSGSGLDEEAVVAHCTARLARFKRPAAVRIATTLPRGATGKVQKGVLRDLLDDLSGPRSAAP